MEIVYNVKSNNFQLISLKNGSFNQEKSENNQLNILGVNLSQPSQKNSHLSTNLPLKTNQKSEGGIQNSISINPIRITQKVKPITNAKQEYLNLQDLHKLDLICRLQQLLEIIWMRIYHKQYDSIEDSIDQMIFLASQTTVERLIDICYTQKLAYLKTAIDWIPLIANKIQEQIAKSIKRILKQQRQYAHNLINSFESSPNLQSNK